MWNSKYFLITITTLALGAASAQAAGEILRDADGSIRYMNQHDAMKACPAGTHLPTIRELAKESQARGAIGILEVNQGNSDGVPTGYYKISAINPNGQKDEFYFNCEGYKRPNGDLGNNWFWSSSLHSNYSDFGYLLNGGSGFVGYGDSPDNNNPAVLCVHGR